MHKENTTSNHEQRAHWISVLARATHAQLAAATAGFDLPDIEIVKPAECGTLMIEARAGGAGQRFNSGEATVTRCVVRLEDRLGFAYALGRDKQKALLCATLDAVLQDPQYQAALLNEVVTPLHVAAIERKASASRKAAATKVEFFTLVRGDG
jgi:alpha-D-ribose 1-methylphosphonate 5-triphosphate synthase subunit PhnG